MVLSAAPSLTSQLHGVESLPRSPAAVWRALAEARLFVSGGGSLVQDVTSARSALYYLGTMLAASARGVPVAVVGQGVGPIGRPWLRGLARAAFSRAQIISVRDRGSARLLAEMGVSVTAGVGADLAFLARRAPIDRVSSMLARSGLDGGGPRLGIAPRPWPGFDPSLLGRAAATFASRLGARVAVLCFDLARDREACIQVARTSGGRLVEASTPEDLLGLVGAMDLVIGLRLHSLIFAAAQCVPAVGFAYDPKVAAFASGAGLGLPLRVGAPCDAIEEALQTAWESRVPTRNLLLERLPSLAALARDGVDAVAELL